MKAMSVQVNPFILGPFLTFLLSPLFSLLDKEMRKRARMRLQKKETELPLYGDSISESDSPASVP
jgi:hypothetical protein